MGNMGGAIRPGVTVGWGISFGSFAGKQFVDDEVRAITSIAELGERYPIRSVPSKLELERAIRLGILSATRRKEIP